MTNKNILINIKNQLKEGYVDLSSTHDKKEIKLLSELIRNYAKVKTSVFRQKRYEDQYKVSYKIADDNSKNLASILGEYYYAEIVPIEDTSELSLLEDVEILRCNYDIPALCIGDKIYLHEVNIEVSISDFVKSSDGTNIYYVDDLFVETDNSVKSYNKCKEEVHYMIDRQSKFDDINKELEECKRELSYHRDRYESTKFYYDKHKNTYKYKNRFINISKNSKYKE